MINLVYTTVSNFDDAKNIAKILITKKIAKCVQIKENITSIYEWDGNIEESVEFGIFIKTLYEDAVRAFFKEYHPYEVPAILSWKASANEEFEDWMKST